MNIEKQEAVIWFAPTAKKRFLTFRAACMAEARARIKKKYPDEYDIDEHGNRYCYWSFLANKRNSEKVLVRYARVIAKGYREKNKKNK
jgi:hypothetical protein